MIRVGNSPYLECSSRGDKRFSAFFARLEFYNGKSIEVIYQAHKIFKDGDVSGTLTALGWKEAKGKKAVNQLECRELYSQLWDLYFEEHPELLKVILTYNGFSDMFGQEGRACQAVEIYRIQQKHLMKEAL